MSAPSIDRPSPDPLAPLVPEPFMPGREPPPPPAPSADDAGPPAGAGRRDPAWVWPAFVGLLVATGALYLWGLGASGWGNSFYSAAVQAGTKSWKAMLFGSSDASNFITVDKTPASLWVMEISARIFGLNSWSVLAPQALEGVATVALLYATIKRWFGAGAGLLAGAVVAVAPVAALMFRFNNPDALLVLVLTAAVYATVRAMEDGGTAWLVGAGAMVGVGFLTKELQALLVLPAIGVSYLLAGPPKLGRRIYQLVLAGAGMVAAAGWWVALLVLWPASSRPYIGGSQNNTFWNVLFGYNGLGRLSGNESGSVGGAPAGAGRWGATGLLRLFGADMGGDASWLLPAALILLVAILLATWRAGRRDRTRAAMVLCGLWLLVSALVISLSKGIIHPYYTVALAPPVGGVAGIGAATLWRGRSSLAARLVLAVAVAVTAWWSFTLLDRTPAWHPALRGWLLAGGLVLAFVVAVGADQFRGRLSAGFLVLLATTALGGSAAYALATAAQAHAGAIPSVGPAAAARLGGAGGPGGPPGAAGTRAGGRLVAPGGFGPPAGFNGPGGFGPPARFGGAGGILSASQPNAALVSLLEAGSSNYRWTAAAVSSEQAAGYQLSSGKPIMALGGFNGTDPTPTLAQFEAYVAAGRIHYFLGGAGGRGGGPQAASTTTQISSWVASHFSATTVGGVTVYDLTAPVASP